MHGRVSQKKQGGRFPRVFFPLDTKKIQQYHNNTNNKKTMSPKKRSIPISIGYNDENDANGVAAPSKKNMVKKRCGNNNKKLVSLRQIFDNAPILDVHRYSHTLFSSSFFFHLFSSLPVASFFSL